MSKTVLIIGACGRFGRHAAHAFAVDGWRVRTLSRRSVKVEDAVESVVADATDWRAIERATEGCDMLVNAANTAYPGWHKFIPRLTESILRGTEQSPITIAVPANVYVYGREMPPLLSADTPHNADTPWGKVRADMEASYRLAASASRQIILLRSGEFLERMVTGGWFDSHIIKNLHTGKILYPGPLDRKHAWAYLPDISRALVSLANRRHRCNQFEDVGFAGHTLTGHQLIEAIEVEKCTSLNVTRIPWQTVRLMGLFSANMRAVGQLSYLWRVPHEIDAARFSTLCPDFVTTSFDAVLKDVLSAPAPSINSFPQARFESWLLPDLLRLSAQ